MHVYVLIHITHYIHYEYSYNTNMCMYYRTTTCTSIIGILIQKSLSCCDMPLSREKGEVIVVTVYFHKNHLLEIFLRMVVWECSADSVILKAFMSILSAFSSPLIRIHFPTW